MAAIDGERDGLRHGRRCEGLARHRLLLQASAHLHGSPAGGLHRRYVIERQEFRQQCPRPPIRKQRPHLRDDALVLGRAPVRHNLGDRIERMPSGHRTSAGQKSRCPDLHRSEQRGQPPRANILKRPLQPTMRADPPLAAIVLRLRLNKVVSQSRERPSNLGRYGPGTSTLIARWRCAGSCDAKVRWRHPSITTHVPIPDGVHNGRFTGLVIADCPRNHYRSWAMSISCTRLGLEIVLAVQDISEQATDCLPCQATDRCAALVEGRPQCARKVIGYSGLQPSLSVPGKATTRPPASVNPSSPINRGFKLREIAGHPANIATPRPCNLPATPTSASSPETSGARRARHLRLHRNRSRLRRHASRRLSESGRYKSFSWRRAAGRGPGSRPDGLRENLCRPEGGGIPGRNRNRVKRPHHVPAPARSWAAPVPSTA